jgi:hypothetical protein
MQDWVNRMWDGQVPPNITPESCTVTLIVTISQVRTAVILYIDSLKWEIKAAHTQLINQHLTQLSKETPTLLTQIEGFRRMCTLLCDEKRLDRSVAQLRADIILQRDLLGDLTQKCAQKVIESEKIEQQRTLLENVEERLRENANQGGIRGATHCFSERSGLALYYCRTCEKAVHHDRKPGALTRRSN